MEPVRIEVEARASGRAGVPALTPATLRKARQALGWTVQDLAVVSAVPTATIYAHEARRSWGRMQQRNTVAVLKALQAAGVVFHVRQERRRTKAIGGTAHANRA
jgi:hypothetical protein